MKEVNVKDHVKDLLEEYDPSIPDRTADGLRKLWLQYKPRSIEVIKAELRQQQETVGVPIPALKAIGKGLAKEAAKRVDDFIPLTRLLWDQYGREGRVVALIPLGRMELVRPEVIVPLLFDMCRTCLTWEDCDRLAMDALEPIVRKDPEMWVQKIRPWAKDENKWVRRAAITVLGRLAMKQEKYIQDCLECCQVLLFDDDLDVKRAVSFAIRVAARGDTAPVRDFLAASIPPGDAAATWVLCDVIRSMAKKLLPEFRSLGKNFEEWLLIPELNSRERKSIESALNKLA